MLSAPPDTATASSGLASNGAKRAMARAKDASTDLSGAPLTGRVSTAAQALLLSFRALRHFLRRLGEFALQHAVGLAGLLVLVERAERQAELQQIVRSF